MNLGVGVRQQLPVILHTLNDGRAPFDDKNLRTLCRGCHIKTHDGVPHKTDPGYAALVREMLD